MIFIKRALQVSFIIDSPTKLSPYLFDPPKSNKSINLIVRCLGLNYLEKLNSFYLLRVLERELLKINKYKIN